MDFDLEDLVEDFGVPGLIFGLGAIVLAPIFGPALAKVGKPIAKTAIKTSIVLYDKTKTVLAEASETFEDLLAETKAELSEESEPKALEGS